MRQKVDVAAMTMSDEADSSVALWLLSGGPYADTCVGTRTGQSASATPTKDCRPKA